MMSGRISTRPCKIALLTTLILGSSILVRDSAVYEKVKLGIMPYGRHLVMENSQKTYQ